MTSNNLSGPKGSFDGPTRASTLDANDQLRSADAYRDLIIAYKNGSPLRIRDVASVEDDAENVRLAAWANNLPAVVLNIQRQPGANVIEVVDRIKALLPQLQSTLPGNLDVQVLTDRTTTIRASVKDVQFELALAVALVVMVTFLFLRNVYANLIPNFAVPLSLIGTFGVMYPSGFSINNPTLMALTIATGFVVDDAIVMVEQHRPLRSTGDSPLEAALKLEADRLHHPLADLLADRRADPAAVHGRRRRAAVPRSSPSPGGGDPDFRLRLLTLTPMLSAKLSPHRRGPAGPLRRAAGRVIDGLIAQYAKALPLVTAAQPLTLLVAIATLALTALLYHGHAQRASSRCRTPGVIRSVARSAASRSPSRPCPSAAAPLPRWCWKDPAVASLSSYIGVDGSNPTLNTGRLLINLQAAQRARRHRQRSDPAPAPELDHLPGIKLYMQPVQDLTIEDRVARTQYQFTLQDADPDVLAEWVPKLVARLQELPQLADVASDWQDKACRPT